MSSLMIQEPPTRCCFNIKTATVALGIYHMIVSLLLLADYSLEVASGNGYCSSLEGHYFKIVDITLSFLLIIMLFIISLNLLLGVLKNRERQLVPFMSLQVLDFLLSLLTFFSSYVQLPAIMTFSPFIHMRGQTKVPYLAIQSMDFCLSILILFSSYMEIPVYFSFKANNHMTYMTSLEKLTSEDYTKVMIAFTIAFLAVLILKASMFNCVLRCYKHMKASKREQVKVIPEFPDKVRNSEF
uniref:Lysosomal protein transmembrane 5 n=1 Tax=Sphenodon punctatus TaxID=8508 RepID=A0A8D0HFS5_SPHPU